MDSHFIKLSILLLIVSACFHTYSAYEEVGTTVLSVACAWLGVGFMLGGISGVLHGIRISKRRMRK